MAVGGVLLLCVLALVVTFADYTSHPAVAVAHVPPVVGAPNADTTSSGPSPVPTIPVTDVPTPGAPTPVPAGSDRARTAVPSMSLAQLIQQLEARRHHRVPPVG